MEFAGSSVSLNISSRCLEIRSLDTNDVVARHDMPRISFASIGGDLVSSDDVFNDFYLLKRTSIEGIDGLCRLCC